jgi:hypothetical protein
MGGSEDLDFLGQEAIECKGQGPRRLMTTHVQAALGANLLYFDRSERLERVRLLGPRLKIK